MDAKQTNPRPRWWGAWFMLTLEERRLLLGILAIAMLGLAARYLHLRGEQPSPYQPQGARQLEQRSTK